ncbi:MAG TPA: flagellar motor protein MotB [Elusimicrobiota bacterium]|nr:flagellar motor protein MotB [Elusimicrobiota bacterium]
MAIRKARGDEGPKASWMLSYGCLMTQLLVFFVMLFALANKTTEYQLTSIKKRVDSYIVQKNLQDVVRTDYTRKERGLVISLGDKLMFESGKAEINNQAMDIIKDIAKVFREDAEGRPYPNRVSVEGHTDNVRVRTDSPFATNWELSSARATNITRFLVEGLDFQPERLSSSGYAEWWPSPVNYQDIAEKERLSMKPKDVVLHANSSPEKQARNRRVDIVIHRLEMDEMQQWREELMKTVSKVVGKR